MSDLFGRFVVVRLARAGDAVLFAARAVREAFRPPFELRETARQLYEIGWLSVPLIAAAGFAVGIVLSMHTRASLQRFGAEALIPAALTLALVRETGPLVVGLLVSGRVGGPHRERRRDLRRYRITADTRRHAGRDAHRGLRRRRAARASL